MYFYVSKCIYVRTHEQAEEHQQQVVGWESERVRMRESQLDLLKERDSQLAQAATDRDAVKEKLLASQVANLPSL
jgi:hypothetical protein